MNENTRCLLQLLGFLVLVLVWLGGVVGTLVWSCQPGNSGGMVMVLLVGCMGWGFVQEYRQQVSGY